MSEAAGGFVVGLTGGIGSGKSTAAAILAELGAAVVDTDEISRELTAAGGAALAAIRATFGDAVFATDGALDRAALRRIVFADAGERHRLEAILHPLIRAESERRCRAALAAGAPYAVLVVPLLVESGDYRRRVDRVLVVDCPEETRIERVMARSGLAREEARQIVAAQATRETRLNAADEVAYNYSDILALRGEIEALHRRYLARAAGMRR